MSDWQAGDLALCIMGSDKGRVYRVEKVLTNGLQLGLVVEGDYSHHFSKAWCSTCFIKVTPPSDMKLEETSTPKEVEDA